MNVDATNIRIISNQVDSLDGSWRTAATQLQPNEKPHQGQTEFMHLNCRRQVVDLSILSTADRMFRYSNQIDGLRFLPFFFS